MRHPFLLLASAGVASCSSLARLSAFRGGAAPVQLIDAAGDLAAGAADGVASGESVALIASVGARGRGRRLMNEMFGAGFDTASSSAGAWLASSSSSPSVVLLATEGGEAQADARSGADASTLGCFSLALADAVLVHTPSTPTEAQLQESYERIFAQHLAVASAEPAKKVLLVHVGEGGEKAVKKAAAAAWKAASAAASCPSAVLDDAFDLEVSPLPHATLEPEGYAAALDALRAKLGGLPGGLKASGLGGAAAAAWSAACAAVGAQPSDAWLSERHLTESAYDRALSASQGSLAPWAASVAAGRVVRGYGAKAAALIDGALSTFDAGTADVAGATALVAQRGAKLRKAVQNDVASLFAKQHKLLASQQLATYKKNLLKVVSRSGKLEGWQREGLQRQCEKGFDAGLELLYVPGLNGPTKQQLLDAFSKQLTAAATAFQESPALQLQAIGAVRRRTSKGQKPPRGVHVGVGLVGACHSKLGGGQGNLQTFAGYTSGLNSAHFLFSNDGALPDSSGSEPDLLRFQPKLNFDIAI